MNVEEKKKKMERIEEIERIIQDFARKDLYSANCVEVKYLYREKRRLQAEIDDADYEEAIEEDYTPQFIDGSDVPIGGYYE